MQIICFMFSLHKVSNPYPHPNPIRQKMNPDTIGSFLLLWIAWDWQIFVSALYSKELQLHTIPYLERKTVRCRVTATAVDTCFGCILVIATKMGLQLGDLVENHPASRETALKLLVLKEWNGWTRSFLQWFSETMATSLCFDDSVLSSFHQKFRV